MRQLEKYRRLQSAVREDEWQGLENEGEFYFRQLELLKVDLMIAQIEVSQRKRQITVLQSRIDMSRQDQRQMQKEDHKHNESSSEQFVKEFVCSVKECGKHFQKQSGLRLHAMLVHHPAPKLKEGMIFRLSLDQP